MEVENGKENEKRGVKAYIAIVCLVLLFAAGTLRLDIGTDS